MLSVLGTKTAADGGDVSPKLGRKSKLTQSPLNSEAHAVPLCQRWVVHTHNPAGNEFPASKRKSSL